MKEPHIPESSAETPEIPTNNIIQEGTGDGSLRTVPCHLKYPEYFPNYHLAGEGLCFFIVGKLDAAAAFLDYAVCDGEPEAGALAGSTSVIRHLERS